MAAMGTISSQSAFGVCQVPQPRLLCAEYSNSQAVVIARLTDEKAVGDGDGYRYSFETLKRFRGSIPNTFVLWEENSSGRATFDWKMGQKYLLFLSYSDPDHAWTIDGCGNSGPEAQRSDAVIRIQSLAHRRGPATVTGIVTTDSWTTGVPGVKITASSGHATAHAISDSAGRFAFKLEPGTYSFSASKAEKQFRPGPLSYEQPDHLELHPGSCAQIHIEQQ